MHPLRLLLVLGVLLLLLLQHEVALIELHLKDGQGQGLVLIGC